MWADKEQRANCIAYNVTQKLGQLSSFRPESCIVKVYDSLKRVNEEAYEPKIVCIGPYNHHKRYKNTTLEVMEEHKLRYLENFVRRTKVSVLTCVKAMQDLEERTRNCYAEPINDLNSNEFVEMMLLDSCFIVEFLMKYETAPLRDENDAIFQMHHIVMRIIKDLLLLENQLPFFVLDKVFKMTEINLEDSISMAIFAFEGLLPSIELSNVSIHEIQNVEIKHLLGLMHYCWCFPMLPKGNIQDANIDGTINHKRCMDSTVKLQIEQVPTYCCFPVAETSFGFGYRPDGDNEYYLMTNGRSLKAVTELQEFGIDFERSYSRRLFDIKFENGTIRIPPLLVEDVTESIIRNLVAYEQCLPINSPLPKYFTNYVFIMDDLIDSSKDAETLRHKGIISNVVGVDEVVSTIFNKLGLEIIVPSEFFYSDIYDKLNEHCAQKRNRRMANLRQNYCNSPWAFISVVAVVILLLLTVVQTVCSILSVIKDH